MITLDIGSGTQDIVVVRGENRRNWIKMILPSPTRIVAKKIKKATSEKKAIFLTGYTMGGGPCVKAIKMHLNAGFDVFAEEKPALTISDNIEEVKAMGVKICKDLDFDNVVKIEMADVNIDFLEKVLGEVEEILPETMLVAVQDHGFSPEESNRRSRFKLFRRMLKRGHLQDFLLPAEKVPRVFNRMRSVYESIRDKGKDVELYLIDTSFAAIAGGMLSAKEFPALIVNFGNSHVVGAVVGRNGEIYSFFEHHTKVMREMGKDRVHSFIEKFLKGEVSDEDVFKDGGHGAYIKEVVEVKDRVASGPNVHLCNYRRVGGDEMITGNLGMISIFRGDKLEI